MSERGFGSDNHAGAHPTVLSALTGATGGHVNAYGDDPLTEAAVTLIREHLGAPDAEVALVMNGTGANVLGLATVCRPWESVICAESAHINTDECGAPERMAGVKLVPVATPDGKLTPELVRSHLHGFGFEHAAQPRVISISQATEFGTVYAPAEVRALADLAHAHGMLLHMDGARISNAAAGLGVGLGEASVGSGVDVLSLGLTKNGAVLAEAVVLAGDAPRRPLGQAAEEASPLEYGRKGLGQLYSKMRFAAAQFQAMLGGTLWRECAQNANAMATRLAEGARASGVEVAFPVQANEVFAWLPAEVVPGLVARFHFYTWDETPDARGRLLVRWVCAWDTTAEDVDALVAALPRAAG